MRLHQSTRSLYTAGISTGPNFFVHYPYNVTQSYVLGVGGVFAMKLNADTG
jgi:hypothetical protein